MEKHKQRLIKDLAREWQVTEEFVKNNFEDLKDCTDARRFLVDYEFEEWVDHFVQSYKETVLLVVKGLNTILKFIKNTLK